MKKAPTTKGMYYNMMTSNRPSINDTNRRGEFLAYGIIDVIWLLLNKKNKR